MYAIQNIRTGEFVYTTDYRHCPPKQLGDRNRMLTYSSYLMALVDYEVRKCGKDYRIVELGKIKVKRIFKRERSADYV